TVDSLIRSATIVGLILACQVTGCQRATEQVEVTGTVTWNGKPLPNGMIVLQPTEAGQAPAGGKIEDGRFVLHTKPGKWRGQVEAVGSTAQRDPQTGAPIGEMYIPARYNRETKLEANINRDGDNEFDFALTD